MSITINTTKVFYTSLALLLAGGVATWAEPMEVTRSLPLDQLVGTALRDNARLREMRAKWEGMRERPAQERSLPNPMFKYSGMDMTERGSWPNTEEKRYMVEQEFPWFGKLAAKGRIAEQSAEAMQREFEAMQREVVMMVKETYFDLYAAQRSRAITGAEEDVLKDMAKVAETMYTAGERSQQDVLKAQTELTMLRQKLLELDQQEAVAKARLNLLLNQPADAPLGVAVTLPATESEFGDLAALAAQNRPEIKRAQSEIRRGELERGLMQKEFWPDYRLGVEYRSFRSSDDMVMFTVGFDLPFWLSKNRAGVREAEKMIESSKAGLEAAQRQTTFDVQDAHFKLQTARRTLELYRKELLPQADLRFQASEAGYRTGKVDFMDLLESERFRLSARVMAVMAEANVGMQLARLERAVGTNLEKNK